MRLLRINDIDADLDDKTAIGITYQTYDVSEPGKNFVKVSNQFTIPATSNNLSIFGNAQNSQSLSTKVYDEVLCSYWVDNDQIVTNAKCRVEEIEEEDRIKVFLFEKPSIWDTLKKVKWPDFLADFLLYLENVDNIWRPAAPYIGGSNGFFRGFATASEGLFYPMYFSNMYEFAPVEGDPYLEDATNIYEFYDDGTIRADGGHWCVYVKKIFQYIEYTYGVNFLTSGGVLPGNIWDDPVAPTVYTPLRELGIVFAGGASNSTIYFETLTTPKFLPHDDQRAQEDKTLNDFVNSFFQHFNIIIDEVEVSGEKVFRLARFDDIAAIAEVLDWSSRISGRPKFRPLIKGYNQENLIKFKEIYPEGSTIVNSKTLTCLNENLDVTKDLLEIDAYVSAVLPVTGGVVPDMSVAESFKTFSFFVSSGLTADNIDVSLRQAAATIAVATLQLQKPALYSLTSEYNFLGEIIARPRFYEIKKWITQRDLKDFEFFKQYFIRELNGSFFINKISGFNPQKSKDPTKIELIKISDRTPVTPPDLDYWVDGVQDAWFDGENDYLY